MSKLSILSRKTILSIVVVFAAIQASCHRTQLETSFGVEGARFSCADQQCDIVFFVDNQMPNPTRIEYRALLSDSREQVMFELSDELELPALEKTKVERTVSATDRPARLRVTVTTLNGL